MAVLSDAIIHDLLASRPAAGTEGRLFFPSDVGTTYAYYDDGAAWQTINIQGPTGTTGSTGAAGAAATISVGSTATGSAGSSAIVSNSGTSSAAVLDFVVPQGADGKTLRHGTGAPSSGLGVDGDFYIDTTAEAIYGPKTSGAWGSSTSLVGPTGSSGGSGVVTATTPLAYNAGTQTLSIQQANGSQAGYLGSTDWTTFNGKASNPMTTAGDIIYGGASGTPTRLAGGTSGYVLTSTGATSAPSWQASAASGSLILLEQHTAASATQLNFTSSLGTTYDAYRVELVGLTVSSGGTLNLVVSTDGGSTYDSGSNYYTAQLSWSTGGVGAGGPGAGTSILLAPFSGRTVSASASVNTSGYFLIDNPASLYPTFIGELISPDSVSSNPQRLSMTARYSSTTAINAFRVTVSTGTFSGTIRVYGIAK